MKHSILLRLLILMAISSPLISAGALAQWTPPTSEELSMTADLHVPGAAAIYLYREEVTQDKLHTFSIYVRLKILTADGKKYGTVELPYATDTDGGGKTVEDIVGRTVHPDGTVIPMTEKPLKKMVQKSGDIRYMTKVFSLPQVEVGSIVEYRYSLRMGDHFFSAPDWYVQSSLFTRKAYYKWRPTSEVLTDTDDGGKLTSGISYWPILPKGVEVKKTELLTTSDQTGRWLFELSMNDVPPAPDEDQMPPIRNFTYRVLFFYTPYRTPAEFWANKGKSWSKRTDKFIGPGPGVVASVQQVVSPGDAQPVKLKKIYDFVMHFENTDFTREHSQAEEKADGLRVIKTTDDLLVRKRGSSDQLTALFVAMVRAAGMKAYMAVVSNRDQRLFQAGYMSMGQLDDDIAIVMVDGKETFLDPGSRYCPFDQLAWQHTLAGGLRQTDSGTTFTATPGDIYKIDRVDRVADLQMDEQGIVTGNVTIRYTGAPALRLRQQALAGDETSFNKTLTTAAEESFPGGMEIKVASINHLKEYEETLAVMYTVKGSVGSATGKRLVIPADLFEVNTRAHFPHARRETPVYFQFPSMTLDAIRIKLPSTLSVESVPTKEVISLQDQAAYDLRAESSTSSVTIRRSMLVGTVVFPTSEYDELRSFYAKLENKDQETIVLTRSKPSPELGAK